MRATIDKDNTLCIYGNKPIKKVMTEAWDNLIEDYSELKCSNIDFFPNVKLEDDEPIKLSLK